VDPKEYQRLAIETEMIDWAAISQRTGTTLLQRLAHASMGICTESGELADTLKKHIYSGKELDRINIIEELGDLLWYITVAADAVGTDLETIMDLNIGKLRKRYQAAFTEAESLLRDIEAEQEALRTTAQPKPKP